MQIYISRCFAGDGCQKCVSTSQDGQNYTLIASQVGFKMQIYISRCMRVFASQDAPICISRCAYLHLKMVAITSATRCFSLFLLWKTTTKIISISRCRFPHLNWWHLKMYRGASQIQVKLYWHSTQLLCSMWLYPYAELTRRPKARSLQRTSLRAART